MLRTRLVPVVCACFALALKKRVVKFIAGGDLGGRGARPSGSGGQESEKKGGGETFLGERTSVLQKRAIEKNK